jgi:predicted nucleotidyltransferase
VGAEFEAYLDRLRDTLVDRQGVLGLVLLGSTAERDRVDEWSDHDLVVITIEGEQEDMRQDLDWLPAHERIAFAVRETEHGLKVVYDDARVVELAVASLGELSTFRANRYEVVIDRADVADRMRSISLHPVEPADDLAAMRMFLTLVLIGTGRARRGEVLAGGQFVRAHATEHLLTVVRGRVAAPGLDRLDDLDPWRRVELVHPQLGAELGAAQASGVEECGRALLDVADRYLAPAWPDYPVDEVAVVRRRLGW